MTYQIEPKASGSSGPANAGLGRFTTPPLTGWTWTNQLGSTVATSADSDAITLTKPANGANANNWSLYTRPLPASRLVTCAFRYLVSGALSSGQFPGGGICLLQSGTGQFVTAGITTNGSGVTGPVVEGNKFNNVGSYASSYFSPQGETPDLMWLRIFNGSAGVEKRTIEWSLDGEIWLPTKLVDVQWNDFCAPDHIGIAADGWGFAGNATFGVNVKLVSWKEG